MSRFLWFSVYNLLW